MRSSRCVTKFVAVTAALAAVGATLVTVSAATASAGPSSQPPGSEPAAAESTSPSGTTGASLPFDLSAEEEAAFNVEVEFAHCMRDHGVDGLPEPQVTEDGFVLIGLPLVLTDEWTAAQVACQHIFDDAEPRGDRRRRRLGEGCAGRRLPVCRR